MIWNRIRLILVALGAALGATFRRLTRGPLLQSWGFGFEVVVHVMRAVTGFLSSLPPEMASALAESSKPRPTSATRRVAAEVVGDPISGEWITPPGAADSGAILFLHGGGYALGSVDSHRDVISRLALATGLRIFAPNYRLAPAHPYPAALDDALLCYRWMLDSGIPASRIAVCGDSAGGGLSAALIQRLRDDGTPLPSAAVLISPWMDLTCSCASHQSNADSDYLVTEYLHRWAGYYAGGADLRDPLISPHFGDPAGFPATMVMAGSAEILHDEGVEFARRAEKAGVETELHIGYEMPHDWPLLAAVTPSAEQSIQQMASFVSRHIPREDGA